MSADIAATLRAARAQIADPARWTQEYEARTADGEPTFPEDPAATCWCAMGAVSRVITGPIPQPAIRLPGLIAMARSRAVRLMADVLGGQYLTDYNDTHTHADVLALYDRAIAAADQEAPHE